MLLKQAMDRFGSRHRKNAGFCILLGILLGVAWIWIRPPKSAAHASSANIQNAGKANLQAASPAEQARITANFASLPLSFEPNQGQTDPQVKFLSRNSRYNLFLTSNEAVFTLPIGHEKSEKAKDPAEPKEVPHATSQAVLRMKIVGANPAPRVVGDDQVAGHTNYLVGNDDTKWVRDVKQYARVNYEDIYPGVDLTFYGQQHQLEFDYIVQPGANPDTIALQIEGAHNIHTDAAGDLVLSSPAGDLRLRKPVAYQTEGNLRKQVDAHFVVKGTEVAFAVGPYDHSRELVIDPSFVYSTYLGGGNVDEGFAIAVEQNCATAGQCAAFITGETASPAFPRMNAYQNTLPSGATNAFVTKLNAAGTALVYSTFLGGSGVGTNKTDSGNAIAVDAGGNAYVVGSTQSTDFPIVGSAAQATFGGGTQDAFAAKFNSSGQLVYSTYIGGEGDETGLGVAADTSGAIYATGDTKSALFHTQSPLQGALGGGSGDTDAFVVKISGSTGQYVYSSYLGGSLVDRGTGIAVDAAGNMYVSGITFSANLPVTASALQGACGGCGGATDHSFVAVIKSDLTLYTYFTYLAGDKSDEAQSIVVDSAGNAYVVGGTQSTTGFPTKNAYQGGLNGGTSSAFVMKLNPTLTGTNSLLYSTYFGGNSDTAGIGIAVGSGSNPKAYITGWTTSTTLPTTSNVPQSANAGGYDAFIAELDPSASGAGSLVISTYYGGKKDDNGSKLAGIAVDGQGNMYVTGETQSSPTDLFPLVAGSFQTTFGTSHDAFVAKLSPTTIPTQFTVAVGSVSPASISRGSTGTATVTVNSTGYVGTVNLGCAVSPSTANPPSCTLSSATVTLASSSDSQTATITLGTKASAAMLTNSAVWLLPLPGLALIGACFGDRKSRKKLLGVTFGVLALTGLLLLAACGSGTGGGGGGGGGGGTTTGNYTVTVQGAANGANTSGSATFSVQ